MKKPTIKLMSLYFLLMLGSAAIYLLLRLVGLEERGTKIVQDEDGTLKEKPIKEAK